MSATGDSLRLKVERAEEHFTSFKNTVLRRDGSVQPTQSVGFHYDSDRQRIVATPHNFAEPELKWGIMLGDVLHQLRCGLDHMLYAIASGRRALTTKEERNLHFPIFENPTDFDVDWRVSQEFWEPVIGRDAFAAVKLAQPYERNKANPSSDPLWILHKLDNVDKHRTILILDNRLSVSGTARSATMEMPFDVIKQPVKPDAEVFAIDWPIEEEPLEVQVERLAPHIVLTGTGLCDNLRIFPLVRKMIDAVKGVIGDFESRRLI